MRTAAVAIVRNAADIAPLTALHHWLLGCERVWVIDNGSSDGTYEALRGLSQRVKGLRVDSNPGPFDQARWTSDMANQLLREGFELIVPYDADECWNISMTEVARSMRRRDVNVICAPVVNYIQSRRVLKAEPGAWRQATRRVERAFNPDLHASEVMGTGKLAFIERAFPRKVLLAPPKGAEVAILKGNHMVSFDGVKIANRRNFACLHLPLRAASELEKRVTDYRMRHKPFRLHPAAGWRLDYWAEMLASGNISREWAANSYDEAGMLDVFGERRPTVPDTRMVRHLTRAQRFWDALGKSRSTYWPALLRVAFKARRSPFKVPETIEDLPAPQNVPA
jgi:hypothetical protein